MKTFGIMFIGTFFICLFIFIMQFLWLYVDDMVGKGLGLDVLAKFFYYAALTLVPKSLPLAVLLASLITFGNFGERVELTAMKAAGIPLFRVMGPLIVFCTVLCGASFYFQDVVIPHAQLKLTTLLVSMKQKSPELEIPEGRFYDGIEGYNLYVDHKDRDTGMLYGVVIYNMTDGFDDAHILKADSGRLVATADKNYLRMTLYNGEQFENLKTDQINRRNIPYRREVFERKTMLIEFNDEFSLEQGSWLSTTASSKNMARLEHDMDSLRQEQDSIGRAYYHSLSNTAYSSYTPSSRDSTRLREEHLTRINMDSLFYSSTRDQQLQWRTAEKTKLENMHAETTLKKESVYNADKQIRRHHIEWWNKIVQSLACLVFFFIGAPLGAIIRKGGLGMPVVISVLIFIIYYILDTSGAKLAREGELTVWFGRWLSTLVLAPLGAFFTVKANRDSTVFNMDAYKSLFRWLVAKPAERHYAGKEVIIDDPDYARCISKLESLSESCRLYLAQHGDRRLPAYLPLFTSATGRDDALDDIALQMEDVVSELENSRDRVVLDRLNRYPLFNTRDHLCPLPAGWLPKVAAAILPVGFLLWLRAAFFTHRRQTNLATIMATNEELTHIIHDRNLLNNQ